jgi:hypothetical protein
LVFEGTEALVNGYFQISTCEYHPSYPSVDVDFSADKYLLDPISKEQPVVNTTIKVGFGNWGIKSPSYLVVRGVENILCSG